MESNEEEQEEEEEAIDSKRPFSTRGRGKHHLRNRIFRRLMVDLGRADWMTWCWVADMSMCPPR